MPQSLWSLNKRDHCFKEASSGRAQREPGPLNGSEERMTPVAALDGRDL